MENARMPAGARKHRERGDCVESFLGAMPVFLQVEDEALGEIRKRLYKRRFSRGDTVFLCGDDVTTLFMVEAGQVEVYKTDNEYRRLTLWHVGPGELFCVPSVLSGTAVTNAEVVQDAVVYCLDKEDFDELLELFPRIAAGFLKCLSSRIVHYSRSVDTIAFANAPARVAGVLLQNAGNDARGAMVCRLSRSELVSLTGSCRETVSRILSRFKKEKVIALEETAIVILDREALKKKTAAGP